MGYGSRANQNSLDNRIYPPPPSDAKIVTNSDEIAALKPGEKFVMSGREWVRGRDAD